jgi:HSP20 family protein
MSESQHQETGKRPAAGEASSRTGFTPRVDILETEHELTLFADMPGVAPDQLDIRYSDGQLSLHGQVTPRQANTTYLRKEYEVGDFHRVFTVGETIDASRISAQMKSGVLILHLPKVERAKPRRIEVRAG